MKNKKASLEISVNAIVILVIAITMLGIGLTFMRSKMTQAGNLMNDVNQQVKDQITNQFVGGSADKVAVSKPSYSLKVSDNSLVYVGVRNELPTKYGFTIELVPVNPLTVGIVNANPATPGDPAVGKMGFLWNQKTQLDIGEVKVIPIKAITSQVGQGTYLFKVNVCYNAAGSEDETCSVAAGDTPYSSKEFFIEVTS